MEYELIKWIHLISATLLFGTGLGSAFYKWSADRSNNLQAIAHTNRIVVLADWIFTAPTVIIQPLSGIWLAHIMGYSLNDSWIISTYVFYFIAGSCWLPVVWLQIKMRNLSQLALENNTDLDDIYHRYKQRWFRLGMPAFASMVIIYYLMIAKPVINL